MNIKKKSQLSIIGDGSNLINLKKLSDNNPNIIFHGKQVREDMAKFYKANNLIPYISQVAAGKLENLSVFGGDYDTPDGTGVRDYIHVVDLAIGHIKALQALEENRQVLTVNLGTGTGYSVLDIVKAFERVSGKGVPYQIVDRRSGDIATCYADPAYAKEKLGWKAERELDEMCKDTWRWQSNNPDVYSR
jgi:UDP-glucose 4-epimerase